MSEETAPPLEPEVIGPDEKLGKLPALREPQSIAPWAPSALAQLSDEEFEQRIALAAKERQRISQIQRAVMRVDVDYGVVPGTQKPTLLKPGSEILNKLAGLTPRFECRRQEGDGITAPQIRHEVKCQLYNGDGSLVAEGDGSTNSWEKKYRYRNAERICPACGAPAIIKGKDEYGGGWLCWRKKEGCGAKFKTGHAEIESQQAGLEENPDPHDLDNTLLKMAAKRAMIAATLIAHAASGIFTQDLEDLEPAGAPAPAAKPAASRKKPAPAQAKAGGLTEGQLRLLFARAAHRAGELGMTEDGDPKRLLDHVVRAFGFESIRDVTAEKKDDVLEALQVAEAPEADAQGQGDIPF